MDPQTVTAVVSTVAAIGALAAAVASFISARATKLAAEAAKSAAQAQLFSAFLTEYGGADMLMSLRRLRNYFDLKGEKQFTAKHEAALLAKEPEALEAEKARRHVKFYFMKALQLHNSGFVDAKFLRDTCSVDGINILFDIVEPMELAINDRYDRAPFTTLRSLIGRAGTGKLIAPIPLSPDSAMKPGGDD